MKLLIILIIFIASILSAKSQTADEIIDIMLIANSCDFHSQIESLSMNGTIEYVNKNQIFYLEFYTKSDEKYFVTERYKEGVNRFQMGYDGDDCWMRHYEAGNKVKDFDLESLKSFIYVFLTPLYKASKENLEYELLDIDDSGEHKKYILKINNKLFDKEAIVKVNGKDWTIDKFIMGDSEIQIKSYKSFNGLVLPQDFEVYHKKERYTKFLITDYKINEEIDDSIFERPED